MFEIQLWRYGGFTQKKIFELHQQYRSAFKSKLPRIDSGLDEDNELAWRVAMSGHATLQEIRETWSYEDVLQCNFLMDIHHVYSWLNTQKPEEE